MELLELKNKMLEMFEITDISLLKDKLMECVIKHDTDKYDKYLELARNDLSVDNMQKIYQFYEADRKEKKQDFTPKSIAKLMAKLCKGDVIDMCAGSGALTIQAWNLNKDTKFTLYELDGNVIPFLLFNLAVRNINAEVIQKDVILDKKLAKYQVKRADKYSEVTYENYNI